MRKKHGLRPHEQRALESNPQGQQVQAAPPDRGAPATRERQPKHGKHGKK